MIVKRDHAAVSHWFHQFEPALVDEFNAPATSRCYDTLCAHSRFAPIALRQGSAYAAFTLARIAHVSQRSFDPVSPRRGCIRLLKQNHWFLSMKDLKVSDLPSQDHSRHWMYVAAPSVQSFESNERNGKVVHFPIDG